ncbi:hypothetical protein KSX_90810 [Ktedonospora formicarum]|uniref:Uncharacterized protein n=1 Tax=Ktedonospora formicarum TaxID=2778364 RepID=A0A8J3IBJ3_9CHLR|nr:hypothetical protein KSX_90810 [Ktedonospora formicarum]
MALAHLHGIEGFCCLGPLSNNMHVQISKANLLMRIAQLGGQTYTNIE